MQALFVFLAQFGMVFLLGFQSRCVRDGNYFAAVLNSLGLGICGLVITPAIADPDLIWSNTPTLIAFLAAGPLGIVCAMWVHDRTLSKERRTALSEMQTNPVDFELNQICYPSKEPKK